MSSGRKTGVLGRAGLALFGAAALAVALLVPRGAAASSEQVLYSFCAQPNCADGANPQAGLVMDAAGNLYGTTFHGGTTAVLASGGGVVFKLAPDGTQSVLYAFCPLSFPCADGFEPLGDLVIDAVGNLYGTTRAGGYCPFVLGDDGVVFKLAPDGTLSVLHTFCSRPGFADGAVPVDGLLIDAARNLYGTTFNGGTGGFGVVFKLAPDGTETVLYSFCPPGPPCADGGGPRAGLIMDQAGNLYGTTYHGGTSDKGVVFRLAPDGTYTVLYNFCSQAGCADGARPFAGVLMDGAGNLYGTTSQGGTSPFVAGGVGVVFQLAPDGTYTVLYSFCPLGFPCADGATPVAGLVADAAGNLYGTTPNGVRGIVFELAPDGTQTVLYSFGSGMVDGTRPLAGLLMDTAGNLYGTTSRGGGASHAGAVFEVTP